MNSRYDIAIIGSGFGGSLMAMVAKRIGLSVIMLERSRHPRFAIGESTSPLTNLILEQIADRYDLPRLVPLTTFGSWQRTYPEVICGLKRGFTFFSHRPGERYRTADDRRNQLLVAASPNDDVSDVHWLRSDVDAFFAREATDIGVDYIDEVELSTPTWTDPDSSVSERRSSDSRPGIHSGGRGGLADLTGARHGQSIALQAKLIIDATGPRGFLSRALRIPEDSFVGYPKTQTLFSHFTDVERCDAMPDFLDSPPGRARGGSPPYPLDDAALHHTFDGGWMWLLRFGNGVTSAGVAVTDQFAADVGLSDGEAAWGRILARFPSMEDQFAGARNIRPFTYWPHLSYRAANLQGSGWVMLPSAASFIDPLFSTGFPLTLLGVERLGAILQDAWETDRWTQRMAEYEAITRGEAEATAALIGGSYAGMANFPAFTSLSMFYFAAASYSEMARRVKPELVQRYLASDHAAFGKAMADCADRVRTSARGWSAEDTAVFDNDVTGAVAALNIAGLCDPSKRNWYDADLADVVRSANKLGYAPEEMRRIIDEAPWAKGCVINL